MKAGNPDLQYKWDTPNEDDEEEAFKELKESIVESMRFSKSLTDLKERIETILNECDFEEK